MEKFKIDVYNLKGFWYTVDNVKNLDVLNKVKINKIIFNNIRKLKKKLNDK